MGSLHDCPRKGEIQNLAFDNFAVIDEKMKKNDDLSRIELQRILLTRCNITAGLETNFSACKSSG